MEQPLDESELYVYCPHCANMLISKEIDRELVKTCENCGFVFWNNPKPVVSIILYRENKILMLQRASEPFKDYWVLPGGFVKLKETAQEAVKREAKEETNLDVEIEGIVGAYRIDNDPRGNHLDIIYYGNENGIVSLSQEDRNWKYVDLDSLPENIAYKHREAIIDWKKGK